MERRSFLGMAGAVFGLGGCANSVVGRTVSTALANSFGSTSAFDPDYADRLPYASMAVSLPNKPRALLVLARASQGKLHWMSADRALLVTREGRLVRTVGLPENLAGTSFLTGDFFGGRAPDGSEASKRLIDLEPRNRYGVVVEATLHRGAREETRIHRHTYDTVRFEERCRAPQLSWEFANTYWIDEKGMIWRSIQHISPWLPPVEMEITKPFLG